MNLLAVCEFSECLFVCDRCIENMCFLDIIPLVNVVFVVVLNVVV